MRRSVQYLGVFFLVLLLLGVFLVPKKSYALIAQNPGLNILLIDGLVFDSIPEFQDISFTSSDEVIHTIHIETRKYEEVRLEKYVFSTVDTITASTDITITPTPILSPLPTITPAPILESKVTPTVSPILTPTSTPTPLPTEIPTPTPIGEDIWDKLAACESGGNWAIDTGNGYFGGLQFSQGAWESVGGSGSPASATREEQIEKGKKLQAIRGWGAWGACAKKLNLLAP